MSWKVWRRKGTGEVVGYCEAAYDGFKPGGDHAQLVVTVEEQPPTMPVVPPVLSLEERIAALEQRLR